MIDIEGGQMSDWDFPTGTTGSEDDLLHGSVDGRQTDAAWQIGSEGEWLFRSICGSEDGRLEGGSLSGCDGEDGRHGLLRVFPTPAVLYSVLAECGCR